jgi:hypothetical protein
MNIVMESAGTVNSDHFLIRNTHVYEELFYLLTVVSLNHNDLLLVLLLFRLSFLSLLFGILAFLGDSTVGLEVLTQYRCTFFQNLTIFL